MVNRESLVESTEALFDEEVVLLETGLSKTKDKEKTIRAEYLERFFKMLFRATTEKEAIRVLERADSELSSSDVDSNKLSVIEGGLQKLITKFGDKKKAFSSPKLRRAVEKKEWGEAASLMKMVVKEQHEVERLGDDEKEEMFRFIGIFEDGAEKEIEKVSLEIHEDNNSARKDLVERVSSVQTEILEKQFSFERAGKVEEVEPIIKVEESRHDELKEKFDGELGDEVAKKSIRTLKRSLKKISSGELKIEELEEREVTVLWRAATDVLWNGENLDPELEKYTKEVVDSCDTVFRDWEEERGYSAKREGSSAYSPREAHVGGERMYSRKEMNEAFEKFSRETKGNKPSSLENFIQEMVDKKQIKEDDKGRHYWVGEDMGDFYNLLARKAREVSAVVPEINQIPFSRAPEAFQYLFLKELPGKAGVNQLDMEGAKEVAERIMYSKYSMSALWRKGGDVENFQAAALNFFARTGEEPILSLLAKYPEKLTTIENGEGIIDIDYRDLMTFSEELPPNGKRTWLNYISTGELNSEGESSTEERRREFFDAFVKYKLESMRNMEIIDGDEFNSRIESYKGVRDELWEIYGDYYSTLAKFIQSTTLRYGRVAVNQNIVVDKDGVGGFEFANPLGGEAPYKLHRNTVFQFIQRYIGSGKFAAWFIDRVDAGMNSYLAYSRKETLPHFILASSNDVANPGADKFFYDGVGSEGDKEKYSKQWAEFWNDAIFDDPFEGQDGRTGNEDMRIMFEIKSKAREKLNKLKDADREFIEKADFSNLEKVSGITLMGSNLEKFNSLIDNFGYRMLKYDSMRSKREGDFFGKYIAAYNEVYGASIAISERPNSETALAFATAIAAFSTGEFSVKDIFHNVMGVINKKHWTGIHEPKTSFGSGWKNVEEVGEKSTVELKGKKLLSPIGWLPWKLPRTTIAEYLTKHEDPMWMEPLVFENAFQAGQILPKDYEELKLDWIKSAYVGKKIVNLKIPFLKKKDGKAHEISVRAGWISIGKIPIPTPLLPIMLVRGWWVDKLKLDWHDFKYITREELKERFEKLKKYFEG